PRRRPARRAGGRARSRAGRATPRTRDLRGRGGRSRLPGAVLLRRERDRALAAAAAEGARYAAEGERRRLGKGVRRARTRAEYPAGGAATGGGAAGLGVQGDGADGRPWRRQDDDA